MSPQSEEEPTIERQEREYRPLEPAELELMRRSEEMAEMSVFGNFDLDPEDGPAPRELVKQQAKEHFRYKISDYHHDRKSELDAFSTEWGSFDLTLVEEFQRVVDDSEREEDIQQFLQRYPELLTVLLRGGHGRYVIPKPEMGSVGTETKRRVADFFLAEMNSAGFTWYGIELESASTRYRTRDGSFAKPLNHTIEQIRDWRRWLNGNAGQARQSRASGGYGYPGIDGNLEGFVFIGRRGEHSVRYNELRQEVKASGNITIHSYDTLIEIMRGVATRPTRRA